jgi:hypothetical protein
MIAIPIANLASDGCECSHSQAIVIKLIGLFLQDEIVLQALFMLSTVQLHFIGSPLSDTQRHVFPSISRFTIRISER